MSDPSAKNILAEDCRRAAGILDRFRLPQNMKGIDRYVPKDLIDKARGLAILTVGKAGIVLSIRSGRGLILAKLPNGNWSAPSGLSMVSIGAGLQIGAELTEFVIVLNSDKAVEKFAKSGRFSLGGNMAVAAGPVGRNAEVMVTLARSYSNSQGLFVGVSLEGTVFIERKRENKRYYGRKVRAMELLDGTIPVPDEAQVLITAIARCEQRSQLPHAAAAPVPGPGPVPVPVPSEPIPVPSPSSGQRSGPLPSNKDAQEEIEMHGRRMTDMSSSKPTGSPSTKYGQPKSGNLTIETSQQLMGQKDGPSTSTSLSATPLSSKSKRPLPPLPVPTEINGLSNTAPTSEVPLVPLDNKSPGMAMALFDFKGEEPGDLAFRKGDIVEVIEKRDRNDWWTGRLQGRMGDFPGTFVQVM